MAVDADFVTHRRRLLSGVGLNRLDRFHDPGQLLSGLPHEVVMRGVPQIANYFGWAFDPMHYPGPFQAGTSGGFVLTETAAGGGNVFGVSVHQGHGGGWDIRTDNGDNDTEILQLTGEPYRYTVGKSFVFMIGFQTNDVDGEMFFGMAIGDTSPIASAPTDGLYFAKAEAATTMTFNARKNATSTTVATTGATLANDTLRYYAFTVSESGKIDVYSGTNPLDMTHYGSVAAGNANIPNDEDLGLHLAVQTGTTASTIWWIRALAFGGDL